MQKPAELARLRHGYLSSPEEIVDEAKNGRMFILVDDEDRENEGDLVIPAGRTERGMRPPSPPR